MSVHATSKQVEKQFLHLAQELSNYFPSLDLRFNLTTETATARCIAPELSNQPLEINLDIKNSKHTVYETILAIKSLGRFFDD